jgi:hypothetical protein
MKLNWIFALVSKKYYISFSNKKFMHSIYLQIARDNLAFQKSSLDGEEQCSRRKWNGKVTYTCKQLDPRNINYYVTVHMRTKVSFPKIHVLYNRGTYNRQHIKLL